MPRILPFKAVRPTRDKVSLMASRSYESYSTEELEARLRDNPFSFLHIINPGFKYHKKISGKVRYGLVKNRYQEFREDGIFMQDKESSYYVYKIVNREGYSFHGIVGAADVEDLNTEGIRKHEATLKDREAMFMEYLKTVGFNAEAVLLTYPDNDAITEIMQEVMNSRAEYEFTTTYRDTHYLWPISDVETVKRIRQAFEDIPAAYIADGHHRTASSLLLAENAGALTPAEKDNSYRFFMSYLIPESELKIYQFNRLVKDLYGLDKDEFLIGLDTYFRIDNRGADYYKPSKKHHFSMYLDGDFYSLYLRKDRYKMTNALDALDTDILYHTILKPLLGIEDPRTEDRLAYSHGKKDLAHVRSLVDCGKFAVGFGMLPITVEELKAVADQGLVMPPKSTFIEPKLRSGVTIYEF